MTTAEADGRAVYPRVLVHAEATAELSLVERYIGADGVNALEAPVTEVVAEQGAGVSCYRLQECGDATLHVGTMSAPPRTGCPGGDACLCRRRPARAYRCLRRH
ncbi:MAG: hypothetical protein U5L11_08930 [Arhodomonas sp.]|nr:hypothetical protein [Arhodomonas sp.]